MSQPKETRVTQGPPGLDLPIPKMDLVEVSLRSDLLVVLDIKVLLCHDNLIRCSAPTSVLLRRGHSRFPTRGRWRRRGGPAGARGVLSLSSGAPSLSFCVFFGRPTISFGNPFIQPLVRIYIVHVYFARAVVQDVGGTWLDSMSLFLGEAWSTTHDRLHFLKRHEPASRLQQVQHELLAFGRVPSRSRYSWGGLGNPFAGTMPRCSSQELPVRRYEFRALRVTSVQSGRIAGLVIHHSTSKSCCPGFYLQ